jgi:hypothetical protein
MMAEPVPCRAAALHQCNYTSGLTIGGSLVSDSTSRVGPAEAITVRVTPDTFAALQLAQPFIGRRSMQDLLGMIIDDFLSDLERREPGFQTALTGLVEARARQAGVLARRNTDRTRTKA